MNAALAAYLVIGITFNGAHRSVDAIEYSTGIKGCMRALAGMRAQIAQRASGDESRLSFEPYCTDSKPAWWTP